MHNLGGKLIFIFFLLLLLLITIFFFHKKGVPSFTYHQVNPKSNITPELFEEHLKILKEKNMTGITLTEYSKQQIQKNSVLITLDDGYYDNYIHVYPLLKKYNIKATIFLNTLYIKEERKSSPSDLTLSKEEINYFSVNNFINNKDRGSEHYLSWKEIKEMESSGLIDFQCHSHKHAPIFKNNFLLGIFSKPSIDSSDLFLYGDTHEGFPLFEKRGEYSTKGVIIKHEFFKSFQNFYITTLKGKSNSEILKKGQEFINKNSEKYFYWETMEDFKARVLKDFLENKNLIEKNLNKNISSFCWPWGHIGKDIIPLLREHGIKTFVTTKKGTNSYKGNSSYIYRIELREFTPLKFKINLFIGRNLILGKIYSLIS